MPCAPGGSYGAHVSTERDVASVAEAAYVFGYPLVLSAHATREVNRLFVGPVSANARRIWGWLDVGAQPWVVSIPDTIGRFSVVWLRDAWHTAFASAGARTTGTGACAFAVLGPARHGAHLRAGLSPIAAPTRIVRVTGCLEASTVADAAFAEGIRLAPLSGWHGHDDGAAPTLAEPGDDRSAAAVQEIEGLDTWTFLSELLALSEGNPPEGCQRELMAQVRALVDGPRTVAVEDGVRRGREAVRCGAAIPAGEEVGAWWMDYDLGRYGTDHLRRATAARAGLRAEPASDELSAVADCDADGQPLTGRERYVLRFPEHATPPVSAFWTLSTPAGSITDLHGLVLDADGSLSIRIQHRLPEDHHPGNWLPAPTGDFAVALRLYWPGEAALERRWFPPPLTRLAAVTPRTGRSAPPSRAG
jgi:hypothetical protein